MTEDMQEPTPVPTAALPTTDGLSTAGMVLGIIGISLVWIPFLGVVALPLGILAVIFGGIGFYKVQSEKVAMSIAKPVTALTTGGLTILIWFLWLMFFATV